MTRRLLDDSVRAIVHHRRRRTVHRGPTSKGSSSSHGAATPGTGDARVLQKVEDSPKPIVMAMHGTALGGGLEVAMAGHYRVAVPDAQMGQPEVNLGIIPGRRRDVLAAAPGRSRKGDRDVRVRQACESSRRARGGARSIASSRAIWPPARPPSHVRWPREPLLIRRHASGRTNCRRRVRSRPC